MWAVLEGCLATVLVAASVRMSPLLRGLLSSVPRTFLVNPHSSNQSSHTLSQALPSPRFPVKLGSALSTLKRVCSVCRTQITWSQECLFCPCLPRGQCLQLRLGTSLCPGALLTFVEM